jgi:hypothetical protein
MAGAAAFLMDACLFAAFGTAPEAILANTLDPRTQWHESISG